jgi:DNA polymerase III alpha subunit (gram-positive type)
MIKLNNIIKEFQNKSINEVRFDTVQIKDFLDRVSSYSGKTFIWLDSETSGLTFSRPLQITQLAAIATDSEGNKLGEFNEKAKLEPNIAKSAEDPESGVSKALKYTRYASGKEAEKEQQPILAEFVEWTTSFPDPILIAYNVPFDLEIFNTVTKGKRLKSTTLDIMKMAQYLWIPLHQQLAKEGNERSQEILNILGTSASGRLVGSTLGKVANSFGIDSSGAHDALEDVTMMSKVYREMLKDLEQYQDFKIDTDTRRDRIGADARFRRKDKETRKKLRKTGQYIQK